MNFKEFVPWWSDYQGDCLGALFRSSLAHGRLSRRIFSPIWLGSDTQIAVLAVESCHLVSLYYVLLNKNTKE